jgi:hypothetical protein
VSDFSPVTDARPRPCIQPPVHLSVTVRERQRARSLVVTGREVDELSLGALIRIVHCESPSPVVDAAWMLVQRDQQVRRGRANQIALSLEDQVSRWRQPTTQWARHIRRHHALAVIPVDGTGDGLESGQR